MTAICGIISLDLQPADDSVQNMLDALPLNTSVGQRYLVSHSHGGFGVYQQFPLSLAAEDQARSVWEQDGLCVAAAADVYNGKTLALQLGESRPRAFPEPALIAALYRRHGLDCVRQLEGAFAFALWDNHQRQLLLATDPFGIRPLHYFWNGKKLIFGSRINAIFKVPGSSGQIDVGAIYQYLFYSCIPTPHTVYQDIRKVPPGHYLLLNTSGLQIKPYWSLRFEEDASVPVEKFAEGIRERLAQAVDSQSRYDGRQESVGAFLSGGTDSSTVSGLLGRELKQKSRTFSIGFPEDRFNEIAYARIAANHFGTDHHEYFVTPSDAADLIPRLVAAYDEPFGNASAIPTFYCAQLAQQHGVDVMLAGDGGDELFGGNTRYATDEVFEVYQRAPRWLRRGFESLLFGLPVPNVGIIDKARKYVRRSNIPQPKRFFSYNLLYAVDPHEFFSDDFLAAVPRDYALKVAEEHYRGGEASSMLNRLLNIDLKIAIVDNDLRKVTRMCELANVRARYPMLDRQLVEFSGTIPARLKLKGFDKRYIFKQAFRNFLPPAILAKKKHGFGLPISPWLRNDPRLREIARDTLLSKASRERGYFRSGLFEQLFKWHTNDQTNFFGDNLWVFLMLELWHQKRA